MTDAFDAQRAASMRLRASSSAQRIGRLKQLREAFVARSAQWHAAGSRDFDRSPAELDSTEIQPLLGAASEAIGRLHGWMHPARILPALLGAGPSGRVSHVPRGRCLIVSPCGNPLAMTLGPLIAAVAAGNTAILKPSDAAPRMAAALASLIEAVFPADEVTVFQGGRDTAIALLQLPFDHVFFSGSTAAGRTVMAAAARHPTSVTLQLGGKNPAVVDETADLELAVRNILRAKFSSSGQTCAAPDHVLVHDRVRAEFTERCIELLAQTHALDDGHGAGSVRQSRVVGSQHAERLKALLDDALGRGARIRYGGSMSLQARTCAPTLVDHVPARARMNSEEIFGPILPLYGFSDLQDVLDRLNQAPAFPMLYVYGNDKANIHALLASTSSGHVSVNHRVVQDSNGAIGHPDAWAARGHQGFLAFSHERHVAGR